MNTSLNFKTWIEADIPSADAASQTSNIERFNIKDQRFIRKMLSLSRLINKRVFRNNDANQYDPIIQSIDYQDMSDYFMDTLAPERVQAIEKAAYMDREFLNELLTVGQEIAQEKGLANSLSWFSEYE